MLQLTSVYVYRWSVPTGQCFVSQIKDRKIDSWNIKIVSCVKMASVVTGFHSYRVPLGCGESKIRIFNLQPTSVEQLWGHNSTMYPNFESLPPEHRRIHMKNCSDHKGKRGSNQILEEYTLIKWSVRIIGINYSRLNELLRRVIVLWTFPVFLCLFINIFILFAECNQTFHAQ